MVRTTLLSSSIPTGSINKHMNNTQSHSNKTWIGLVIIVVVAGIAYFYMSGSSANVSNSTLSSSNAAVGAQVLGLLGQIQSLKIETGFFADATFKTLRDFSVPIPAVNVGRPNPFAPLSSDVVTK